MPPETSPVKFLPLGAIIQEFKIGGRNITLGFPRQADYETVAHPYFGETIGRIPNRVSDGMVKNLNGRDYSLAQNERGITTLHGGVKGWGKCIWDGPKQVRRDGRDVLEFTLKSPDGDEGFPGEVEVRIWYHIDRKVQGQRGCTGVEEVALDVEYEVEMVGREQDIHETVCSLTNHAYWNIGPSPSIEGTGILFATNRQLEADSRYQIPTGRIVRSPDVGPDQQSTAFGSLGPSIDECFVLDENPSSVPLDTRGRQLRRCVAAYCPETRIHLEVTTTEPSFQFYSGDGINVPAIPDRGDGHGAVPARGPRSGFAVEPNRYVNAVNQPGWRNMVLLRRGQVWGCKNRYRAWCDAPV